MLAGCVPLCRIPIWLWHVHQVQKASIVHDPHSRESQRFSFVTIEMTEEAEAAIDGSYMVDIVGLWWTSSMCSGKSTHSRALLRTPHEKWTLAATSIVVGITTGIGTVIETVATEVIMIVNAMMTEGGGRRCRGMFQGEEPIGRYHYFLDFFLVNWRWCFCGYCDLHSVFLFWRDSFCLVQGL